MASPAVANNVVYIGSSDHKLYAVDAHGHDELQRRAEGVHAAVDRRPPAA